MGVQTSIHVFSNLDQCNADHILEKTNFCTWSPEKDPKYQDPAIFSSSYKF